MNKTSPPKPRKQRRWLVRGCVVTIFIGFALVCLVSSFGVVSIVQVVFT